MIFVHLILHSKMKKTILLFVITLVFACSKKPKDLIVKTQIKGLKKGVVYLQRVIDTTMVTVDSVVVNGESIFELYSELEEPDMFYLLLDKNSKEADRIEFFADKGVIEVNTSLKNFVLNTKIKGSEHQKVLEDYDKIMKRLNNKNLNLIKESFEAQKDGNTALYANILEQQNNLIKSKYLQTVNFALNHKDSEVAPFIALTEIYNANISLLDTINKSLTPKVKASKYGKALEEFIKKRQE